MIAALHVRHAAKQEKRNEKKPYQSPSILTVQNSTFVITVVKVVLSFVKKNILKRSLT